MQQLWQIIARIFRALGTLIDHIFRTLITLIVILFVLSLPFWPGRNLYEALHEAEQIQTYLDVLDTQPPLSAAAFDTSQPERTVVLEGVISDRTPTLFRDVLVVSHEHYYIGGRTRRWYERDPQVQPLVVNIGSSAAQVQVERAAADGPAASYTLYNLPRAFAEPDNRWYGLAQGDQVVLVGSVVRDADQHYLDAAMLCAGDLAGCTDGLNTARRDLLDGTFFLAIITLALGAVSLVVVVVGVFRRPSV